MSNCKIFGKSIVKYGQQIRNLSSGSNKRIGIVGCPFSKGQQIRGPELAPKGKVIFNKLFDVCISLEYSMARGSLWVPAICTCFN